MAIVISQPELPLSLSAAPELIFGLVAPIGVDLDLVTEPLEQSLGEMDYEVRRFRLTQLMRDVPIDLPLDDPHYVASFRQRIAYANEVRRQLGDEALATMAVSAIRSYRAEERARERHDQPDDHGIDTADEDEETPIPRQAYIIRQIKRPEEVRLLRGVYGRQFILVAAYAPQELRTRRIAELERRSRGGLASDFSAQNLSNELVMQDARETLDQHGQNVGNPFPWAMSSLTPVQNRRPRR